MGWRHPDRNLFQSDWIIISLTQLQHFEGCRLPTQAALLKRFHPLPSSPPPTSVSNIILQTAVSRPRYSVRFLLYVMPRKHWCDATCGGSVLNRQMRLTPRDSSPSGQTEPGLWQQCHSKYVREAESRERRGFLLGRSPNLQPPLSHLLPLNQNRRASLSSWATWGSGRLDIT